MQTEEDMRLVWINRSGGLTAWRWVEWNYKVCMKSPPWKAPCLVSIIIKRMEASLTSPRGAIRWMGTPLI